MERAMKCDDMVPLGVITREFYSSLDGFSAGVSQKNSFCTAAGRQRGEFFAKLGH